jgi:hypothetical protein
MMGAAGSVAKPIISGELSISMATSERDFAHFGPLK